MFLKQFLEKGVKKIICSVLFVLCAASWIWCNEIITREINTAPFNGILINQGYVRFHQSNEYRVVVSADSDVDRYVSIEVIDSVLNIGIKNLPIITFDVFNIDVYGHVTGIAIHGAGTFECAEKITVPSFNADISGIGTLKMNITGDDISVRIGGIGTLEGHIECDAFNTEITGGGFININGKCKSAYIACNTPGVYGTFGTFDCINFITDDTTIIVDGSVTANINAVRSLKATISNDGKIYYRGDPQLNVKGNRNNVRRME
jgi:hypothetical protein